MAPASFSVARQVPPPVEGRVPRQNCGLWQVLRHGGGGGGPKFLSGGETFIESRSLLSAEAFHAEAFCAEAFHAEAFHAEAFHAEALCEPKPFMTKPFVSRSLL